VSVPKRGLPPQRRMRHDRHFVEELAQRMGEGIGRMIPIASITSNQDQPRSALGAIDDLVASIRTHGILEPLLIRKRPDDPGCYELISGERRFHAALEVGLTEVPCIELDVSNQHALEIALIENLQRKDLGPLEEAEGFQTLIDKYGYTHQQVAKAVGRSRVTVTETLQLLSLPQEVRDACRHADITAKGVLLEIAKAPDRASMLRLIERYTAEGLDRSDLRALRKHLASGKDSDAAPGGPTGSGDEDAGVKGHGGPTRSKPFVIRYRHPDKRFSISLRFRTESEDPPGPGQIISALEELIADIRRQESESLKQG